MIDHNHPQNLESSPDVAMTEPVHGRKPVLAQLTRLLWAALLVGQVFGAQAGVVFTTLYSFTGGNDGDNPNGLVQGSDGIFLWHDCQRRHERRWHGLQNQHQWGADQFVFLHRRQ